MSKEGFRKVTISQEGSNLLTLLMKPTKINTPQKKNKLQKLSRLFSKLFFQNKTSKPSKTILHTEY